VPPLPALGGKFCVEGLPSICEKPVPRVAALHTHFSLNQLPRARQPSSQRWRHMQTWIDNAILVHGQRKSGTTLLQNLLDGSEHVFVYPAELKLQWLIGKWTNVESYYRLADSQLSEHSWDNFSYSNYRKMWEEARAAGQIRSLEQAVRFDARAAHASSVMFPRDPQMWCTKEIGAPTDRLVTSWLKMFPQGKVLLITRNPRMTIRAILNDRRRRGIQMNARRIAEIIYETLLVRRQQRRLGTNRAVMTVSYEDLTSDTESEMKKVSYFLGVPYNNVFSIPTVLSEPVVVKTSSVKTFAVFQPAQSWRQGLTVRERVLVELLVPAMRAVISLREWLGSR